jgi:hypothetical protein
VKRDDVQSAKASAVELLAISRKQVKALRVANARLRAEVDAYRRQAEAAEDSVRRAYRGFAEAATRR